MRSRSRTFEALFFKDLLLDIKRDDQILGSSIQASSFNIILSFNLSLEISPETSPKKMAQVKSEKAIFAMIIV